MSKSIVEAIAIQSSLSNVFKAYADITKWKDILSDVLDVQIVYDDGLHQEFTMIVQRPNGSETVKAIRFCHPNNKIEMFQTTPPPGFKFMQGVWTFRKQEKQVLVEAHRLFEFENLPAGVNGEELLRGFLKKNLNSFKNYLEKPCPTCG